MASRGRGEGVRRGVTLGAESGRAGGSLPGGEVEHGKPGHEERYLWAGMELNKEWTCSGDKGLSVVRAGAVCACFGGGHCQRSRLKGIREFSESS